MSKVCKTHCSEFVVCISIIKTACIQYEAQVIIDYTVPLYHVMCTCTIIVRDTAGSTSFVPYIPTLHTLSVLLNLTSLRVVCIKSYLGGVTVGFIIVAIMPLCVFT